MGNGSQVLSRAALATALMWAGCASAQEVRGPESPASTSAGSTPLPEQASAPTGGPTESSGLEDIVVTARKVAENLQDVPISVTAISGEGLQRQNVVQLSDMARVAPGLTMKAGNSQASALNIQLRGQYQNDTLATLDPSVGTYVDGFYWARAYGLNADFLDIQSTQVLRGPQGTLFGRNTTGGALLIQTNDPHTDKITGLVSGGYGRFDERTGTAILNLPIVEDRIALRVAGNFVKRDGYVDSIPYTFNGVTAPTARILAFPLANDVNPRGSVGRKLGGRNNYTVRAKLLIKATDNFSLLFSAEQFRFRSYAQNWRLAVVDTLPGNLANTEAGLELGAATAAAAGPLGQAFYANYTPVNNNTDRVGLNEDPLYYTKTRTYTGTATLDTFFGAVKFIGGYRHVDSYNSIDLDGSPIHILDTFGLQDLSQYSGELQITGKAFDDKLDFAAGAFYFKEYGIDRSFSETAPVASTLATGFANFTRSVLYGDVDTRSQGVYAQGTFHLTDRLSATGGIRYSVEDKGLAVFNRTVNRATGNTTVCSLSGAPLVSLPEPCRVFRRDAFSGISYTAGLNYNLNDDTLLYVKTSKGFRSGGQQLRATGGTGGFIPFRPEISREHEAGIKTELFDRRLRVNLATFLNHVNDLQRSTINVFFDGGVARTATIVGNAGKSRTYGGELEVTALLFDGFTLTGNAAYIKPKYLQYSSPNGTTGLFFDRRSERFEQVPRWQWSLSGNYDHTFDFGKINLNATYSWQDDTAINPINFTFDTAANVARDVSSTAVYSIPAARAILKATTQEAGGQLNLRAAVTVLDGALEVAAWGRNVTNFRPFVGSLVFAPPIATISHQKRDPAMYGGTVTFRFGQ